MGRTFFLAVFLAIGPSCCKTITDDPYRSLKVIEDEPADRALPYYPKDEQFIKVNPPGFTWTKNQKAHTYNFLLYREDGTNEFYYGEDNLKSTVVALKKTLEPGNYSWLVTFCDSNGKQFGRSKIRTFTVEKEIPTLIMPNVSELKELVKGKKPRIFLSPLNIKVLQRKIKTNPQSVPFWGMCRSLADSALTQHLYPEPAPYKDSVFDVTEWRRIYKPVKTGTANMVRMALVWKITGELKYLKGAKKWLLHFASWNPNGITSFRVPQNSGFEGNTEASMPLLERMGIVYDWIGDQLTEKEREIVLASIRVRGNQMLKRYHDHNFLSEPWDNHTVRSLAFTGLAGLATLGEIPDADEWLDYVIKCYITSFPTWGGDDGGWSQGLAYNSTYNLYQTNFVEALNQCSNVNLYNKPFFRNNGYFGLYCSPPYADRGAFGDGGERSHAPKDKLLMERYAKAYGDPYLLWQAEQIFPEKDRGNGKGLLKRGHLWQGYMMEDVIGILNSREMEIEPSSPSSLPSSKLFEDVGWVSMHSDLGDAENDVWMLFKSSPFGSFSHSHADQNSFQINAFGESLLIDSGYYPYYGGPHHFLWTRQTRAHNAILVNDRGQHVQSMAARGRIVDYQTSNGHTIVTAECSPGYNLPTSETVIKHWEANMSDPLPSMDTETKEMLRTVVFNHDKEKPWIVVKDYVNTQDPALFSYLLHALEKIEVDSLQQRMQVKKGNAVLDIYLLSSEEIKIGQTDKFTVEPDLNAAGQPDQWHLSATNTSKKRELHFLSLIIPRRANDPPCKVEKIQGENAYGFKFGNKEIRAWMGMGKKGPIQLDGTSEPETQLMVIDHQAKEKVKAKI